MQLQLRINAFVQLGVFLNQLSLSNEGSEMAQQLQFAKANNGWFTEDNLRFSCKSWSRALSEENIKQWLSPYPIQTKNPKIVAIVMAGNLPLMGFHDFISVLISGNKVLAKLSSNDKHLLPYLAKQLVSIEAGFKDHISFTEGKLENFDAVIATGSNNTARYFDYYFGKYPNIIRKNRNSVAVLTGTETIEQLESLADDIFRYFGLGCRNVSKIYIPKDYDFDPFFNAMFSWKHVINDHKYINNYDYNKAVYLMSLFNILDNEFLLLKEDKGFSSPISVVFYEYYDSLENLAQHFSENKQNIQCIISEKGLDNAIPFGKAQTPNLWDYADGIDTLEFLLEL
jgi:hypothetical protein